MQYMVLLLSTKVRGGLSVHSLIENCSAMLCSSHSSCLPTGRHELS